MFYHMYYVSYVSAGTSQVQIISIITSLLSFFNVPVYGVQYLVITNVQTDIQTYRVPTLQRDLGF